MFIINQRGSKYGNYQLIELQLITIKKSSTNYVNYQLIELILC